MSANIPALIWATMLAEAESAFESFAEQDWSHDPGPRSQNRWKNVKTGKIVYSASNPGGQRPAAKQPEQSSPAAGAQPAEQKPQAGPKPAEAPKSVQPARAPIVRKTPEEREQLYQTARAAVKDVLAGERTPEATHALIDHLSTLTVKQLTAIKKEYGLKASGPRKEELKKKIAARMAGVTLPADQQKRAEAKTPEPWAGKGEPDIGQVYNAPTGDLQVDPERFQFKMNTNKEGVTQELKSVAKWNPDFAGVLAVWKDPADGKTYVVNGHHRRELAGRLGIDNLAVRYIDAPNATDARAVGALINMAGGRGTAMDAAKFMRDAKAGPEQLKASGISLKGKLIEDAMPLTKLNDRIFDRVVRGSFDPEKAAAIGKHLADPDLQNKLVSLLDKREEDGKDLSTKTVEEMAREMAETPTHTVQESGGLFGDIESEESLFVERNELKSFIRGALSKDVRDFQAVSSQRRAGRVAEAGNTLNVEKNKAIAQENEGLKNVFDTLVNRKGAVSDAVNDAAKKYADAKGKKAKDAAKSAAVESVRAAIKTEADATSVGGASKAEPSKPDESVPGLLGKGAAGDHPGAAKPGADAADGGRKEPGGNGVKAEDKSPGYPETEGHPDLKQIEQMQGLTDEERAVETRAREHAVKNYDKLREQYLNKPGNAVKDKEGNVKSVVLNTDEWRDQFEGYKGTNAQAVHEPSSWANKKLLKEMMTSQKGKGKNTFAMYGGGGGSGKGTAIKDFFNEEDNPIRLDQVADNAAKIGKQFDEATAHGYKPQFIFVDRKPADAWKGVVGRAINGHKKSGMGRTVPLDVAMTANHKARKAALEILKTRLDIPPSVIDNVGGEGRRKIIEDRDAAIAHLEKQISENEATAKQDHEEAIKHVHDLHASGEMPTEMATALLGKHFKGGNKDEPRTGLSGQKPVSKDNPAAADQLPKSTVGGLGEHGRPSGDAGARSEAGRGPGGAGGGVQGKDEDAQGGRQSSGGSGVDSYVSQAMANLKKTSRTAGGVVDTSASKGKADKMANVSGAEAAEHANRNFEQVIKDVHASRTNEFKSPRQVSDFVDQVNKDVNKGIVKEGVLDRTDDSDKFPYTKAADLPAAKKQFSEEFAKRLNDPKADPVETAAWVEWRANLTDHFWADGVGKTAKALAALPLMKAGLPLPQYRDNKEFFAHSQRTSYDPKNGGESYLDGAWDKFRDYFRTLMPKSETTGGGDEVDAAHAKLQKLFDSATTAPDIHADVTAAKAEIGKLTVAQLKKVAGKFGINDTSGNKSQLLDTIGRKITGRREFADRADPASIGIGATPTTHQHVKDAKQALAAGRLGVKGNATSEPIKSDLSGDTIRRHVVLPNGARVHPDELHRAVAGEDGKAELGPEKLGVKDPMNRGEETHPSFEKAVHSVSAYPIRHGDRVTIQGPHGYSVTKTRKEWRDIHAKLKEKHESMAQWMDRENPDTISEEAKNAPASEGRSKPATEKESASFFHGGNLTQTRMFTEDEPQ